jgi:DNA-binding transcriptional regulator YdaS (Cro superfamily)
MNKKALEKAIGIVGGQSALARALGKKPGHIYHWLYKANGRIPAEQAIPIELATKGQVTRYELRPDIYPLDNHCPPMAAASTQSPS